MTPRAKSALLWGAVAALAFLVLSQGYVAVGGTLPVGPLGAGALAALTGGLSAGVAYAVEHRLAAKGRT